jgi:hypothetical protein
MKAGRKKLPEGSLKKKRTIRMTDEEWEEVSWIFKDKKMTKSGKVRKLVLDAIKMEKEKANQGDEVNAQRNSRNRRQRNKD